MGDARNSDLSQLELAIRRELAYRQKAAFPKNEGVTALSRSPSFNDWTVTDSISNGSLKGNLALHQKPTSPNVPSFSRIPGLPTSSPTTQIKIKTEPYSGEVPGNKATSSSASQDWIGSVNNLFDKKSQADHNSSHQLPPLAPSTREIATATTTSTPNPKPDQLIPRTNTIQKPNLFPGPSVPTKSRSALKRKEIGPELHPTPSPSSGNSVMVVKSDLVCELCQVSCSSGLTMQQHLRGRPHKAKLVWMKQKQSCPREKNRPQPRCDVCQIWCSDWDAMGMHLKGQKHKAKMQESENGGRIVAKKPVRCELCLVNCMNEDLFKMHLKGRQHATRQEMKRRGMI